MIRMYLVKKDVFLKVLEQYKAYTLNVPTIYPYAVYGYGDKQYIAYTDEYMVCTESHLHSVDDSLFEDGLYAPNKQCLCRIDNENTSDEKLTSDICGTIASNIVNKSLLKVYKEDEIKECLNKYQAEYDERLAQKHFIPAEQGLFVYHNCYGYDINGAHNYYTSKIFPKTTYFKYLFDHRKEKPTNKKIINYYVGNLVNTGYRKTYNWIVQQVTFQLTDAELYTDGTIRYENTDGFITQNPKHLLETNGELGDFKLEMCGDLYCYRDKNYWCIQYVDTKGNKVLKGNVLNEVRDRIDLSKGQVVHYDKVKNEFGIFVPSNVTTEVVKEEERDE